MLHEKPIRRIAGDFPRRWMSDDYFDLIVWYSADESVHGFQLCYDKPGNERSVTWIRGESIRHDRVDSGESYPTESSTPILVPGGILDGEIVVNEFWKRSEPLSPAIRQLVSAKLVELLHERQRRAPE